MRKISHSLDVGTEIIWTEPGKGILTQPKSPHMLNMLVNHMSVKSVEQNSG